MNHSDAMISAIAYIISRNTIGKEQIEYITTCGVPGYVVGSYAGATWDEIISQMRHGREVTLGSLMDSRCATWSEIASMATNDSLQLWGDFVEVVEEMKRDVLKSAIEKKMNEMKDGTRNPEHIVRDMQHLVEQKKSSDLIDEKELAKRTMKYIFENKKTKTTTGFLCIDSIIGGGLMSGGLYVLAARPGGGKTTMAINWMTNQVFFGKKPIYYSLEMQPEQIMKKMAECKSGTNNEKDAEYLTAIRDISNGSILISECRSFSVDDILCLTTPHVKAGRDCVFIDYLGLVRTERGESRQQEISYITRTLKMYAMEHKIPVVLLCQMNRDIVKENREPRLSDLRDSGSIEQDADVVIFLSVSNADQSKCTSEVKLLVAKNRHGMFGISEYFVFHGSISRFIHIRNKS